MDEDVEIVGRLHYRGDIRNADPVVGWTDRHGLIISVSASYDEDTDLTTIEYAKRT